MGGLKGVAKRSLAEKSPSRTGKQGQIRAGAGAGAFPSGLLVWSAGLIVWDNAVLCQTIDPCSVWPSVWSAVLLFWSVRLSVCCSGLLPSAFRLVWSGLLVCWSAVLIWSVRLWCITLLVHI